MPGKGRPFAVGNPGGPGRPKIPDDLRKLGPAAIAKLAEAVTSAGMAPQQIQAARDVLDRLYGKAPQPQVVSGADGGPLEIVWRHA